MCVLGKLTFECTLNIKEPNLTLSHSQVHLKIRIIFLKSIHYIFNGINTTVYCK